MIIINKLVPKKNKISKKYNEIDYNSKEYISVINIYNMALKKVESRLLGLKEKVNEYSGYELIQNIISRIKSYESIIKKMQKKKIEYRYEDLIENINDIAGIRIVCLSEVDIYKVVKLISQINDFNVLKEKNYIKKSKKSGYSAYHMIIEVPVHVQNEEVWVKVEIQIRTLGMDFWSNIEHKVKYKSHFKISPKNSIRLRIYANIISKINDNMAKMYKNSYKYIEN